MRLIITLSLILIAIAGYAQRSVKNLKDGLITTVDGISTVLVNNYHPNEDSLSKQCVESCVFIRFNISRDGRFINIAYTKNTPIFIMEALNKAFKLITVKLAIANLAVISKETYLLPLQYTYNYDCGFQHGAFNEPGEKKITIEEEAAYKQRQMAMKQTAASIEQITSFTDGSDGKLRCVLLGPVIIGPIMF